MANTYDLHIRHHSYYVVDRDKEKKAYAEYATMHYGTQRLFKSDNFA